MKTKNYSKAKYVKALILSFSLFCCAIIGLAITPNYTCGCGEIQNGTKLTYIINEVSKITIGKKLF